jgi:hypothetical protein
LKTINTELEFNDWQWRERTTHLASEPLRFGASSKMYEYKVRRDPLRPDYIHYNVTPQMMQGARINVKLDTIILSSQRFMEYHPLALLHSFGDLGPISRIRHLAIDSYVWKCLLANKDWADIITEYRGLKTLYIIGSDARPLPFPPGRRDKQNSFIEGVQKSLSELGEPWTSTSVGIKRNFAILSCHVAAQAIRLERAEKVERKRLREEAEEVKRNKRDQVKM